MPNEREKEEPTGPRSFTVFLAKLASGEADSNLSHELHELLKRLDEEAHARATKVKGKLKLTLSLIVDETGVVAVNYDVEAKAPPRKTTPSIYWVNKASQLVTENPKQQTLALRDVGGGKKEFRSVDDAPVGAPKEA